MEVASCRLALGKRSRMNERSSSVITALRFETLDGGAIQMHEMRQPVGVLSFLRYVG